MLDIYEDILLVESHSRGLEYRLIFFFFLRLRFVRVVSRMHWSIAVFRRRAYLFEPLKNICSTAVSIGCKKKRNHRRNYICFGWWFRRVNGKNLMISSRGSTWDEYLKKKSTWNEKGTCGQICVATKLFPLLCTSGLTTISVCILFLRFSNNSNAANLFVVTPHTS
jgi:hypothetical protein